MISLKEFSEQLELMEKQYGAEEELYPYIYMILREAGFTQKYSVRSVAGARNYKDDKDNNKFDYKELYMGYASFPDMVILDRSFQKSVNDYMYEISKLLCCVEVKSQEKELLNIEGEIKILSGGNSVCLKQLYGAGYRYYHQLDCMNKDFEQEYAGKTYKVRKKKRGNGYTIKKIISKNKKRIEKSTDLIVEKNEENGILIFQIKHNNEVVLEIVGDENWVKEDSIKDELKAKEILALDEFYIVIQKSSGIACIKGKNYQMIKSDNTVTDEGQLIGELLWYGRVIYTNGKEWKYLSIVDVDNNLTNYRNGYIKDVMVDKSIKYKWSERFNKEEFTVIEETLLSNIDDIHSESEWEDFKTKLRNICKDWNKNTKTNL